MNLILASASPRRQALMKLLGYPFTVMPAGVDETLPAGLSAECAPVYLARQKAQAVARQNPDAVVLGCDTGVIIDGTMLGKPKTPKEAAEMLRLLSGRTHLVVTGCALAAGARQTAFAGRTEVTFYPLDEAKISRYIATGEPFDKAGGYGIQSAGALLVRGINGDYFNVVGLPVAQLARELEAFMGGSGRL